MSRYMRLVLNLDGHFEPQAGEMKPGRFEGSGDMFMWHSGSALGSLAALLRQFERSMGVDTDSGSSAGRRGELADRQKNRPFEAPLKQQK